MLLNTEFVEQVDGTLLVRFSIGVGLVEFEQFLDIRAGFGVVQRLDSVVNQGLSKPCGALGDVLVHGHAILNHVGELIC